MLTRSTIGREGTVHFHVSCYVAPPHEISMAEISMTEIAIRHSPDMWSLPADSLTLDVLQGGVINYVRCKALLPQFLAS